jgi:DNA-binding CsgD family transcriptional regulator
VSIAVTPRLSPRETELLRLFADGHTYVTAAAVLGTSPHTTKTQLKSIRGKLGACAKDHAVEIARREGLL